MKMIKSVCVYSASSSQVDEEYLQSATRLGEILSEKKIECFFGSGSTGLMGHLADSMLKHGGKITGIIPKFMYQNGWSHPQLKNIVITHNIHERKQHFLQNSEAVIALAGGCGTLEELLEAITWRQLKLFQGEIYIVNTKHYYDPLLEMLDKCVSSGFMEPDQCNLWKVVEQVDDLIPLL